MYKVLAIVMAFVAILFALAGCERSKSTQDAATDTSAIPVIEESHFYESDQLRVVLPGDIDTIKILEKASDELGNPDVVLLEAENGGVIHRDPSWFSEGQKVRFFIIKEIRSWGAASLTFYWLSPEHSLSEHVEEFKKLPPPALSGFEIFKYGTSIIVFSFERSKESTEFLGVRHKTRIGTDEYVQGAVWSTKSNELTDGKEVWDVFLTDPLSAFEDNVVSISAVLMTELGDYELPSETMMIPYDVGRPYNSIE